MAEPLTLDPRWEWHEIGAWSGPTRLVRGACNHLEVVTVESVAGEPVAQLCLTCDHQLPACDPGWLPAGTRRHYSHRRHHD